MAFGKRIRLFRNKLGLKQKELGEMLGFLGKTSDVRMAQYEAESRTPKDDLIKQMAKIFGVSPKAIMVPDIDSYTGLMHTFFALEDMYGLQISSENDELCLKLDKTNPEYTKLYASFYEWQQMKQKLEAGEITAHEYDNWRYQYPTISASQISVSIPSIDISDLLTK